MVYDEIIEFLAKVPPFQFLDREAIEGLVSKIAVEFFPKGTTILKQGGAPSKHLSVIRKGSVKVVIMSSGAEEVVSDYRGEGDSFGFLSLASGDKSRAGVVAIEDTICYQIDRTTVMRLMDTHPAFTEFFLKSFLNKFIDRTYEEMQSRRLMYGGGDKLLFTTKVGDIVRREAVTATADISIRESAALMSEHRISSLVITDEMGVPVGFMSVRDFRDKVISRGRDVESPVSSIMSATLIKVEAGEFCFEALLKMIHYGIHHLIVVENGGLKGVVTNHDMMMLQGSSPVAVAREIENQQGMDGLAGAVRKVGELVVLLLKDGARAGNITGIITEINDRVLKKVLTLAERKFGPPPVPYCWIVYGSEGRREQTFTTDQDNALIYADAETPEQAREAADYFGKFAAYVNDSLVGIGFARCPGNYMASNPEWCQPFSVWKKYFATWIQTPTPEAILASVILFDFRPVYGDMLLGTKLREFVTAEARRNTMFLKHMADLTVRVKPPLGFFKAFVVDKNGEHKDELNLKFKCIAPLINIVRLYALEQGVAETSTSARIKALAKVDGPAREFAEELGQAFEFASLLRIHHQHEQIEAGKEPDNFINPDTLGNLEKKTLKESCRLISRVQDAIQKQYSPGMTL
jgi:CBS domain-containing protein